MFFCVFIFSILINLCVYQTAKLWEKKTSDNDRETQTETEAAGVEITGVHQLKGSEETCSVVEELMADVRRKNDEISRLHENLERMDRVLGELTKTTTTFATDSVGEDVCLSTERQELFVSKPTPRPVCMALSTGTIVDDDYTAETGRDKCNGETVNTKPEELPEFETVSKRMSRQASTDSGVSRGRSFRDLDSNLGDSGLHLSLSSQSQPADTEPIGLSSAWEQLVEENRCLRSQLAKLTAAPTSTGTRGEEPCADDDIGDSGKAAPLQHHAEQLESEIAALKRTVREQSVYLATDERSSEVPWAHPYDYTSPVTDVDSGDLADQENKEKNDGKETVDGLRRQNALLVERLGAMKFEWSEYEASAERTKSHHEQETARLHDQQSALLDQLAVKTKQVEELGELCRQQRTSGEIADDYWAVLDEIDSRRTRLNNNDDFDSGNPNEEKTIQDFGRRLESWLKDYQALIGQRNSVQRLNGDVVTLCTIPEDRLLLPEDTDDSDMRDCRGEYESLMIDMNSHLESVDRELAELQIPLEQTQLSVDALMTNLEQLGGELREKEREIKASNEEADRLRIEGRLERTQLAVDTLSENLERLRSELKAREEDLRRKDEEIDEIRVENEALRVAVSSPSPLIASDYEEQLVSEIEQLTFDRSLLQQRLQEAEYGIEEVREELTGEMEQLRRQLNATEQLADQRWT